MLSAELVSGIDVALHLLASASSFISNHANDYDGRVLPVVSVSVWYTYVPVVLYSSSAVN